MKDKPQVPAPPADPRNYLYSVPTGLSKQVLASLYELLRGFQAADEKRHGEFLREVLAKSPDQIYSGLITILLRLIFLLFAEDRRLLWQEPAFEKMYSICGLFERLRSENTRFPDVMNQRFGAWAQLLSVFRIIFEGFHHEGIRLPARNGYLFDPERYPFLEGRHFKDHVRV